MPFIGIHNHTDVGSNLRLRDATNKVSEILSYAHLIGHRGICITDHESLSAHVKALDYVKKMKANDPDGWKDFKLGLGNEIYLCPDWVCKENLGRTDLPKFIYPHFILLALDAEGHKGLRELSTKVWLNNSFVSMMQRIPTYMRDLKEMVSKYKGHVIASSSCVGGSLPRMILEAKAEPNNEALRNEVWKECYDWIMQMVELFGEGNFFLEMQPSLNDEQIYVNDFLYSLSENISMVDNVRVPYIITTDAHYLTKADREVHRTFLNAEDGEREVDAFYASTYVMTEEEIHGYMDEYLGRDAVQHGIDNTMMIYDRLEEYTLDKPLHIPYIPKRLDEPDSRLYEKYKDKIPLLKDFYESEHDCDRHLVRDLMEFMEKDEWSRTEKGYAATQECLDAMHIVSKKKNVQWSAYMLQEADYIKLAWANNIMIGAGRGSGVGYRLLYMLGITQIDPLREEVPTFYWRFINPERASDPDIDVDLPGIKRNKMIQVLQNEYGEDRVAKVLTYSTEKSRSAILTAARGLGLDNDTASYIASLVVFDRGQPRSLKQMYYGDEDNKPVPEFVKEMDDHPQLWQMAQKIEGLVCGYGQHAGGVIIVDEPFTEREPLMRAKTGEIITQHDLYECESEGLIKIDLLAINALDKIDTCLQLLLKDGVIEWQGNLKSTYEKYLGVYTLERNAEDMWQMLWDHKVISFFQMEKESGKKAVALAKPHSIGDLAALNSVMRLQSPTKGAEQPLDKFARFKNDITQWYQEMDEAGLTQEEQEVLKGILGGSYGICEAQERLFMLVMHPLIGGFSLGFADKLRRSIAKKHPKDFEALEEEFFANAKEKNLSHNLVTYVWNTLIQTQKGYAFNLSHCAAYSIIGVQELNLNYKYNPIYWQTANLIVESGAADETANDGTDYGKLGVAIAMVQAEDVHVSLPVINEADFGFKPDIPHNRILFGLKGINGINTEISQKIIQNRPYTSMQDFMDKLYGNVVKPSQMIQLIKGGCFTELHSPDRQVTMEWYLRQYLFTPTTKLTMQQLGKMQKLNVIPKELNSALAFLEFKKYVLDDEGLYETHTTMGKRPTKEKYYILDEVSQPFFQKHFTEDSVVKVVDKYYVIGEKKFTKEIDKKVQPLKDWMALPDTLKLYNDALYQELWNKYASGTLPSWSMQSLSYYDGEHELNNVNEDDYGIVNYNQLPTSPRAYETYTRYIGGQPKVIAKYAITRIAGTVLLADNNHHMVTLLTKYGLVNVKFNKQQYAFYNKRISLKLDENSDKKTVLEDSWFKRGNKIIVSGIRREDQFHPLIYQDTIYKHTVALIKEIHEDGTLLLQYERTNVNGGQE